MNKKEVRRKGKNIRKLVGALVAVLLVAAMVIGYFPAETFAATYTDVSTAEGYELSLGNHISTEYSGRIWSDKSVYSGNAEFEMFGGKHGEVEKEEDEDFLVSFSTLGTAQTITGKTPVALDVVFVIDMSDSMRSNTMTNRKSRLANMVDALNSAVESILTMNEHSRIGVVAFGDTTKVLLELGHYEKRGNQFFTLNGSTLNASAKIGNQTYSGSFSTQLNTNIQEGLAQGLNMLIQEDQTTVVIDGTTVQRTPSLVLLSDGEPRASSNRNWWDVAGDTSNNAYEYSINADNGMKVFMTSAYMKKQVNAVYAQDGVANNVTVYTVGVGVESITGDAGQLARVSLDPKTYLTGNQTGNIYTTIRTAVDNYFNGGNPRVNDYTFNHPSQNDITRNEIYYNDSYTPVSDSESIIDTFSNIVTDITLKAVEVPTEIKSGTLEDKSGYITYTDPIGEYMIVGDVKAIVYRDKIYSQKSTDTSVPNKVTYVFEETVDGDIYKNQNLSSIIIQVTTDSEGKETLVVKIPASLIPVRINNVELYSDGSVKTHTNNGAYPVRVVYSVNLKEDIKAEDGSVDVTKLSQEYIDANTNSDGTINFYSNLFTGENNTTVLENGKEVKRTVGNTTVEFEPSHTNPFYYMQEDVAIYEDEQCTRQASSEQQLSDTKTYYYSSEYYNGNRIEKEILARTGAQLKKTDIIAKNNYWYRAEGSPRLNRILEFEGTKTNNVTNTANEFYAPTFQYAAGSTDPYAGKYVIYLGNNGLLQMKASGVLEISKEVEIPEGLSPAVTEFEFTVNFNGNTTVRDTFAYEIVDEAGEVLHTGTIADLGKIKLSDGQKAEIRGLAPGMTYEVTETAVNGYKTAVTGNSGTIEAGVVKTAAFKNTYEVSEVTVPASAGFNGTKAIVNRPWLSSDSFTFVLESRRVETPMPEGSVTIGNYHNEKEVTISGVSDGTTAAQAFDFGSITYDKPGQYEYVISEKVPTTPIAGISYSGAMYIVVVNVTDNGQGALETDVIMTQILDDTGASVAVPLAEGDTVAAFNNTFNAKEVSWMPVGTKDYIDLSGQNLIKTGMFQFKVEAIDNAPMPATAEDGVLYVTNVDSEIAYEAITFTQNEAGLTEESANIYKYKFTEVNQGKPGYTYDANEYEVEVKVYLEDGNVIVESTYPENEKAFTDGATPTRVVFFNSYEPAATSINLSGSKTLTGRDMKDGESFEFALEAANAATEEVALPQNVTVSGGENGKAVNFEFDAITFTKPGTYKFEMKEVVPEGYVEGTRVDGIQYDTHSCMIIVKVKDVNGELKVEENAITYEGSSEFKNTYEVAFDGVGIDLLGQKTLTGRNIVNGEFTFIVEPQDSAPMGNSFRVTSVNTNGEITLLKNVTFDKAGTYVYLIKEDIPEEATAENDYIAHGVKYDTAIYKYTVVVEDVDKTGKLTVVSETLEKSTDGNTYSEVTDVVFANEYGAMPAERPVPLMTKILDGNRPSAMEAGEFEFTMSVTATKLDETTAIPTAELGEHISLSNDADGPTDGVWGPIGNSAGVIEDDINKADIKFGDVKFYKEGIYTFTFAEVMPEAGETDGVTYTDKTVVAIVKVTDNGQGQLRADVVDIYGSQFFINNYNMDPVSLNFNISKKFTGRVDNEWLDTDKFDFEVVILDEDTQEAVDAGDIKFPIAAESAGIQKVTIDKNSTSDASDATVKTVSTPQITINKPGVYKFRIHEVAGDIVGVNYDSTPYDVVVTATDNTKGKLNLNVTLNGEAFGVENGYISFENVYDADSTELSGHNHLVVKKHFTGRENNKWLDTDKFTFKLSAVSAVDENNKALDITSKDVVELPNSTTLVVDNSNKAYPHFGNIKFHKAGTYVFEVKEVIPADAVNNKLNGITYDTTVYTVTVVVGDDYEGAALVVESVTYQDPSGKAVQGLEFKNTYATELVTLEGATNLKINKVLTGREWNDTDSFEFTLEAYDDVTKSAVTAENPTVIMNGTTITLTKAEQEKAFGDIVFKAAGTYKFQIKETKGSLENMTYDSHAVIVTVIVADNTVGGLVVTDGTNLAAAAPSYSGSMTFENVYKPTPVYAAFGGNKVLNGRTLEAGEFRFHIEPLTEGAPIPAQRTVSNDADGNFTFGQAVYTKAGVYEYQITEMKGNLAGVTYDENPVKVVVTVTYDSETGILTSAVSYVKSGQAVDKVEFVNTYETDATEPVDILAMKEVTPSEGNTFVMNGDEFQFEIEPAASNPASDPVERAIVKNAANGNVLFANAQYTEPGVYVYTIHEVDGNKGGIAYDDTVYTVTVTVVDNENAAKLQASVDIVKDRGTTDEVVVRSIRFENGYNPTEASAIIHGHKYLEGGHKDLESDEFTFELKAVDHIIDGSVVTAAADTPMPGGLKGGTVTVQNKATGLFQFERIVYANEGTYAYEIREVNAGKEGYTYDSSVKKVVVSVTSEADGASTGELKATVEGIIDAEGTPLVTFTNTYVPAVTSASISGTKKLTGRDMTVDANGKGEFEFALLDSNGKELHTATNASAGETSAFTFKAIAYDKAGTYRYTIVEKNTNVSGVTYDLETAYVAEVTVTDRDANGAATGQLSATVKYYANDVEITPEEVVFNNSYKAASTTAALGAAKVLSGRTLKENEFTFKLEAITENAPMPEAGLETATNNAQGAVNFGTITFEKAGTYEYQISEVKGEDAHVTYDPVIHKVTVEVTDDLEGQLAATVSGIEEAVFNNTYKADPVEVIFGGKKELVKVLDGREMKAEEFAFILKDSEGNIIDEAWNNEDGTFVFKGIIFDKADSYNFVIEEKNTGVNGVTYDQGICYVHVEVVDDFKGNLIPTVTYGKDAKTGEGVVFTNSYKAASTSVQIGAVKKLTGRDLRAGEFKFVLEDEAGNKIYAANAADGSILFDKITYTEAGTYVYKIYEEKGTAANVTYDNKVYTVTIVVEDDMNGSLQVTSQFDSSRFVFKNTYKNPDVVYTGDATSVAMWFAVAAASMLAVVGALVSKKRKSN